MDFLATLYMLYKNKRVVGIVALVLFILSCIAYYYYASSKIERLKIENRELQQVVEEQKRQIETIKKNYEQLVKTKDDLNREIEEIRKKEDEEIEKIFREAHQKKSLGELALKKAKLVENAVNRATQNLFECFEIISLGGDC